MERMEKLIDNDSEIIYADTSDFGAPELRVQISGCYVQFTETGKPRLTLIQSIAVVNKILQWVEGLSNAKAH